MPQIVGLSINLRTLTLLIHLFVVCKVYSIDSYETF